MIGSQVIVMEEDTDAACYESEDQRTAPDKSVIEGTSQIARAHTSTKDAKNANDGDSHAPIRSVIPRKVSGTMLQLKRYDEQVKLEMAVKDESMDFNSRFQFNSSVKQLNDGRITLSNKRLPTTPLTELHTANAGLPPK